ncbi:MAG: hypothetical protein ACREMQ_03960 [Longimicrobiales bacterium]
MKAAIRLARAVSLLILTIATACDNVNWGGADFTVVPPPPKATTQSGTDEEPTTRAEETLPEGPIVYYVARSAEGGIMVPVGEVSGDSLRPLRARRDPRLFSERFIAEHMRQGAEFVLFKNGVRVGTLVIQTASAEVADACGPTPRAIGTLELSTGAESITEFLALSQLHAPMVPRRADQSLEATRTMTFVAPILAERMLRRRGAQLPGSWTGAMEQVKAFPVSTGQDPGFSATFLVGDLLGSGLDNEGYSLFFLAVPSAAQVGWDTVLVSFHDYPRDGKAAPRVIDFLDWDRDDHVELLQQVYGINDSWFEAVGRGQSNVWRRILRDRCEGSSAAPTDSLTPRPTGSRIPTPLTARPDSVPTAR